MKVGIIGGGGIARVHGPLIQRQPDARLVGIADLNLAAARVLADELGGVASYDDPKALLENEKPDVVHVLVPPEHHAAVSSLALSHGCHVLVEKPMATTSAQARAMMAEAASKGLKLCVNHNMLFDPVIQRARQIVAKGTIGRVRYVEAYYVYDANRNPGWLEEGAELCNWVYRLNGGPLQDLMPHAASLVLEYASGVRSVRVASANRGILPEGWPDDVRVLVETENVTGSIHLTLAEAPDAVTFTLRGTQGSITANMFNGILQVQTRNSLPRAVNRGLSGASVAWQNFAGTVANVFRVATGRFDQSGGMRDLIGGFYESIRIGSAPPISPEDSLAVVELTERVWPKPVVKPTPTRATFHSGGVSGDVDALVTGASGFVGTHLVRRLIDEGQTVRAFVRPGSLHAGRMRKLDVEIFEADLSDGDALRVAARGARKIFHVGAAMSGPWKAHEQTTVDATKHLIEAALAQGTERLIFVSSLAVFETSSVKTPVIDEDSPYHRKPREMGAYAWTKIEAEKLLFEAHRERGLAMTILRPGIVLGPLGPVFFPHLGFRYRDALIMVFRRGRNRLPLTYVENTVDGIYRASVSDAAVGQAFNLVDDGEVTVKEYLKRFGSVAGVHPRILPLPAILPYSAAIAYELAAGLRLIKLGVTSRRQLRAKHHSIPFSNAKAKSELGWAPSVTLEDGMDKTFLWYRERFGTI